MTRLIFALLILSTVDFSFGAALLVENYLALYPGADPRRTYPCEFVSVACNGTVQLPNTDLLATYYSNSSSSFGAMRGESSISVSGPNGQIFDSFVIAGGRAGFLDTWTISAPGATGTGVANLSFTVTGYTTNSRVGGFSGPLLQRYLNDGTGNRQSEVQAVGSGSLPIQTLTIPVPFTYDEPVTFTLFFFGISRLNQPANGSFTSAKYGSTAVLSKIQVLNASHQVQSDFRVLAESRT